MLKIGLVGGGNMGTAIISRIYKRYAVSICEKDTARAGLLKKKYKAVSVDLRTLAQKSNIVILAVKPQDMDSVLLELKNFITPRHLIVSIAAGLTTGYFESRLGKNVKVIRTMPNMPALIGEGVTALVKGKFATDKDLKTAEAIFKNIGETVIVEENLIDAVTAVSGSGPAYVFLFAECFLKAAQELGLEKSVAQKLVLSTLTGSAHLLVRSKEDAGSLRARVTSRGGTTQAALEVFEKHQIEKIFIEALTAAKNRAKELSK